MKQPQDKASKPFLPKRKMYFSADGKAWFVTARQALQMAVAKG